MQSFPIGDPNGFYLVPKATTHPCFWTRQTPYSSQGIRTGSSANPLVPTSPEPIDPTVCTPNPSPLMPLTPLFFPLYPPSAFFGDPAPSVSPDPMLSPSPPPPVSDSEKDLTLLRQEVAALARERPHARYPFPTEPYVSHSPAPTATKKVRGAKKDTAPKRLLTLFQQSLITTEASPAPSEPKKARMRAQKDTPPPPPAPAANPAVERDRSDSPLNLADYPWLTAALKEAEKIKNGSELTTSP